jgi:AraC-like DNA-binding protein
MRLTDDPSSPDKFTLPARTTLAADSYLSVSQFERRFKHLTGVSAKTYARWEELIFSAAQAALGR